MGKSRTLHIDDVRAVFRLVAECRELGADSIAWRTHAFQRLCALVGATMAIGGLSSGWVGEDKLIETIFIGMTPDVTAMFWKYATSILGTPEDVTMGAMRALTPTPLLVRSREQLCGDSAWYKSMLFNDYFRPAGMDDSINSFSETHKPEVYNGVCLYRAPGERRFGARAARILELFHAEITPLVGDVLAPGGEPSAHALSPRLQEMFNLLLRGYSEKQIALEMGLTVHTTHQYVKAIYTHFKVNTRAELLARYVRFQVK